MARRRHRRAADSRECFVGRRASVTAGGVGGSELEIEARRKLATWQHRETRHSAQCRFKMAPVRDRYRGILVEMSVFVMYLVVGRPEWCPVTAGPAPRKPWSDLNVRISQPYCADT